MQAIGKVRGAKKALGKGNKAMAGREKKRTPPKVKKMS
jgi:hypothetical protein